MPELEQMIDKELGITSQTNNLGQWSDVEDFVDKELGIEAPPEATLEEKEKRVKDVFQLADDLELPIDKVDQEYEELQRQRKEFPFGQLQAGEDEFSFRKLFRNLYTKAKPPPLGEASAGKIYNKLTEGFKGAGHIGVEYGVGRYTLGLADLLATPAEAFNDVYLANKKLRKDLIAKGNTVKDVGTKYSPAWRITGPEGNVEFIRPNTVADKKFASSVAELYDGFVGLDVPPAKKTWGEVAKMIGIFRGAASVKSRATGPLPSSIGPLGKASEAGKIGLIYGTADQLRRGIMGDESYRGAIAVIEDAIILAGLSLIASGVGGIWQKLKPTEQRRALKLLGLKEGATEQQIKSAANKYFKKYHPDKVAGMEEEFKKAYEARNILLNPDYGKDIIYRGTPPSTTKLLTGVTEEGIPIKPPKPPIKVEPTPVIAKKPPVVAQEAITPAEPTTVEGVVVDKLVKQEELGVWDEGPTGVPVLIPDTPQQKAAVVREVRKNEGEEAARIVKGLQDLGIRTTETHTTKDEIIITTQNLSEENRKILQATEGVELKVGITGERIHIAQPTAEAEVEVPITKSEREALREKGLAIKEISAMTPNEARQRLAEVMTNEEFEKFVKNRGLQPGFVDIEPFVETMKSAHDWMFTFGEAKRLNPELFDKLMESYGKRNASVEKAVAILKRAVPEQLTFDEARELAFAYEDKRLSPPEGLEEAYEGFAGILDKVEKKGVAEGLFKQPFYERMIAENEAKIEALRETVLQPNKSKKISDLVAENEQLKQIRYLPHNIVARRTVENRLAELQGEERKTFLDSLARISAKYKKRKGKLFLKDYLEEGLLRPEDIDIRKLTADALTGYYYRSALKSLFDYSTEQELIKPATEALRKQGWLNQREIGITSPELKDKLIHPLLGSALAEMKEMKLGKGGGTIRQILGMVKIGQFIKPSIIWTYNAVQKIMKGMYSLDPTREARFLAESTRAVIGKNSLYHKLNESNLYQFPYEVSRGSIEEQIEQYVRQNTKEISRLTKLLEKTTDMTWKAKDLDLKKMIMVGHRALANATWTGDKIQRTQSYLILREMGYPHEEAVKVASHSHGAYSVLSEKYKKLMSPITFVYSFRLLMPIEIVKILTEPLIEIPQAFYKGEPIPKHKWNRWIKSWVGAVAIPVLTDMYMKMRGFEKEGKHLGPLAWKWKKTVIEEGGRKREIVVGINNILNIPIKYWNRITYYNPIRSEARWQQAITRIVKWEIHPLWRIFFWDIKENRKSFGTGLYVYDPNDSWPAQLAQTTKYIFGQAFRFWGGMMDAVGEGQLTEKERKAQEKVFNEGLSKLDKFLFTVFGYKYVRAPLEERRAIAALSLKKELQRRTFEIGRRYEGKKLEERRVDLERWAKKCTSWIEKGMK